MCLLELNEYDGLGWPHCESWKGFQLPKLPSLIAHFSNILGPDAVEDEEIPWLNNLKNKNQVYDFSVDQAHSTSFM